jgi:hypothetical protein
LKKKLKRRRSQFWVKKKGKKLVKKTKETKAKKKICYSEKPTRFRVFVN